MKIKDFKKEYCSGCSACYSVCPEKCISMQEDPEGFLYPIVDIDNCIDCNLCENVCHGTASLTERRPVSVYAAKNPDDGVRSASSSGGIFTIIAEQIIKEGGVVFGACFNDRWEVIHDFVESEDKLFAFRGSN
ncbi:hypothetical protein AGMMS4952_17390 [Spirochaetia bacterium]|nr:hypothetical protein AGMMS4952_17390 [Spirochaetia bacterium]